MLVLVEKVVGLWEMGGVVKDGLCSLGGSLLSHGDLVVEVLWDWGFDNFSDHIGWNTVRLHADDPVINGELSFSLFDDLIKLLDGFFVRGLPSSILNSDDLIETLVLWELSIDTFQIFFVELKDLQETLHFEDFPPARSLKDTENTSKDVSNISTSADIGWKSAIGDGDQNGPRVIQYDIQILDWLNCCFHCFYINANFIADILPCFVDVINLVNVESA